MEENQLIELEKEIKEKTDLVNRLQKELKQTETKNDNLKEEVEKKLSEIQKLQKKIGEKGITKKDDNKYANMAKESEMITLEEQIQKEFLNIQQKCNENLQDKYKVQHIERLIDQQKILTISYIIIKKLDIKEEFYKQYKIKEVLNNYENLNKLSKNGKLNFASLKLCGPNLIFRLTSGSQFKEIKTKCCEIWNLPPTTYYLYDDSFNSMEVALNENIQKYYSYSQPSDSTLPEGYAVFYLMEKLKEQKGLLNCQERSINKNESGDNKNQGIGIGVDLPNCINKIKEGKILLGINKYHYENKNINEDFENFMKEPENNILCFLIVLILFIFSFICVLEKNNKIKNWSKMNIVSHHFITNRLNGSENTQSMYDYLQILTYIDNDIKNENTSLKYFGITQYRFFKTKEKECLDDSKSRNADIFKIYFKMTNLTCYYTGFNGNKKDKDDIIIDNEIISYNDKLDIKHTYSTYNGFFDKTGFVLRYNPFNENESKNVSQIIEKMINSKNNSNNGNNSGILGDNIQGIELTFNYYEPNLDIFSAVSFLVQKSITGNPTISYFDVIPFLTNVYENKKTIRALDILRIILNFVLLLNIIIKIFRKLKENYYNSILSKIMIILNIIFQIKHLLLIFSFSFLVCSYNIFKKYNINSQDYNDNPYYIDFYHYAIKQKEGRYLEQISFLFITIFFLKYSQFIPVIFTLVECFKKSAFEFILLGITIICLILGMTTTTYFVYGSYIDEYSTFKYSFITNLKIICFIEDTDTIIKLNNYFQTFTIILLLFYIIVLRFFFLNLFSPIITEYLRVEREQNKFIKGEKNALTLKEKIGQFFCGCYNIVGKKKELFQQNEEENKKTEDEIELDDLIETK